MSEGVLYRCPGCEIPITDRSKLDKHGEDYKCPSCWHTVELSSLRSGTTPEADQDAE
ncbi:hypothetical protein SAMN06269185_3323 [Natronoarchaeum philippinense]|uniref:Uncharacterized protein n=1 Tax=Natronoarchaeum philippinense TaxID=558529 RepID=A0A285P988_NATPI|nr:hypothetical protein SAMN06269185_3323 [Natronoarchaeum philippinense]